MNTPRPAPEDLLARAAAAHDRGAHREALALLGEAKASRLALRGIDRLRAACFAALGDARSAAEAEREEARLHEFPPVRDPRGEGVPEGVTDDEWLDAALRAIEPFTMLSPARLRSLHALARAVLRERVAGDFVECGVAAGGSSALLAACIARYGGGQRLWCFDTFEGMPAPSARDLDRAGTAATETGWGEGTCAAPERSVMEAAARLGAADRIVTRRGLFDETLPRAMPEIGAIALAHLDGDWYDSTRTALRHVWDRLAPGAAVQIDDYGHWQGCRHAVDEFLAARGERVELARVDYTGVALRRPLACGAQGAVA